MARRTLAEYQASIVHALGAEPATGVSKAEIVNDALNHLCSMHPWAWRRGGPVRLNLTGPITFTDATWTAATKTITKTSAFTSYTRSANDQVYISDGTNAVDGFYTITSKTNNTIVVADDIGATDGSTDIDGTIQFPYVNLPSDFGEEEVITYPASFTRNMIRTTMDEIERLRANPVVAVTTVMYYAINTGQSTTSTAGLDVPRLELYPAPTASVTNAITVTYRRNIARMDTSTNVPQIPPYMDYALDLLCRGMAMNLEDDNPNNAPMIAFRSLIEELKSRDGMSQSRRGVMRGGLWPRTTGLDPLYPESIGDPT